MSTSATSRRTVIAAAVALTAAACSTPTPGQSAPSPDATAPLTPTQPPTLAGGLLRNTARLTPAAEIALPLDFLKAIRTYAPLTGLRPGQGEVLLAAWAQAESGIANLENKDGEAAGYFQLRPSLFTTGNNPYGLRSAADLTNADAVTRALATAYGTVVPECFRPYVSAVELVARSSDPSGARFVTGGLVPLMNKGWVTGVDLSAAPECATNSALA